MKIAERLYQLTGWWNGEKSNIYCIETAGGLLLIDSGEHERQYQAMRSALKQWKLDQKPIIAVLITHAHQDHFGNAAVLQSQGAKVYISSEDDLPMKELQPRAVQTPDPNLKGCKADGILCDGDLLRFGDVKIQAIAIPGHTLGSMAFLAEFEGIKALFCGDTFVIRGAKPQGGLNLELGWDGDPSYSAESYGKSLQKLSEIPVDVICPGHSLPYFGDEKVVFNALYELLKQKGDNE